MSFSNRICQTLHDEHRATIGLMERLEGMIARSRRGSGPDVGDATVRQLLSDLGTGVAAEVERHFTFEEEHLFTYLSAIGDAAIGMHLTGEHSSIRPLGMRLAALAREAAASGFEQEKWEEFCRVGRELCDRIVTHVQKEEMALLPLLEENMDSDSEIRLYEEYTATA